MNNRIDGKALANEILKDLKIRVNKLRHKKIIPILAVICVGKNEASEIYIKQKKKTGKKIGVAIKLFSFSSKVTFQKVAETIKRLNEDKKTHGIIIQRPLPPSIATGSFNQAVDLAKDVDGFRNKSPFNPPVAEAVLYILQKIYLPQGIQESLEKTLVYQAGTGPVGKQRETKDLKRLINIHKNKKIVVIGRGETSGSPIAKTLSKNRIKFLIAHSKTKNINEFLQEADIIISCVGKRGIIKEEMIKKGVVLLGVGINRERGRLYGDYEENKEIKDKAAFYTPTPGGIGPLNVAFLMKNLLTACENQTK